MNRNFYVVLFLLLASFLQAQDLKVSFFDGPVSLKNQDKWVPLKEGLILKSTDAIKVEKKGLGELTSPLGKVSLYKPGIYLVKDLLEGLTARAKGGWESSLSAKVQKVLNPGKGSETATAAMGLRAEDKAQNDNNFMTDGDGPILWSQFKSLLLENNFAEAQSKLARWESFDSDPVQDVYKGFLALYQNQETKALGFWNEVSLDTLAPWYEEYVLAKSRLLLDIGAASEALPLLQSLVKTRPSTAEAQKAYILLYPVYKILGQKAEAEKAKSMTQGFYGP